METIRFRGKGGNDLILGGRGNAKLSGDGGNDEIRGDSDDDELSGGSGDDNLVISPPAKPGASVDCEPLKAAWTGPRRGPLLP